MLYTDFMVGTHTHVFFVLHPHISVFSYPHDNKKGIVIELLGSLDFSLDGVWMLASR